MKRILASLLILSLGFISIMSTVSGSDGSKSSDLSQSKVTMQQNVSMNATSSPKLTSEPTALPTLTPQSTPNPTSLPDLNQKYDVNNNLKGIEKSILNQNPAPTPIPTPTPPMDSSLMRLESSDSLKKENDNKQESLNLPTQENFAAALTNSITAKNISSHSITWEAMYLNPGAFGNRLEMWSSDGGWVDISGTYYTTNGSYLVKNLQPGKRYMCRLTYIVNGAWLTTDIWVKTPLLSTTADINKLNTYQAKDAAIIGDATVYVLENNVIQSTKVGNLGNNNGALEFSFFVEKSGEYILDLHYITTPERYASIDLNGSNLGTYKFEDTSSWSVSNKKELTANLVAGVNNLRIYSFSGWAPDFTKIGVHSTSIKLYEAEDSILSGVNKSNNNYSSGGKKIVDLGGNNYITFNVSVPITGLYSIGIVFSSGENRNLYVSTNNGSPLILQNLNSGGWERWKSSEATVSSTLNKGNNTIKLYNPNTWAPDIDYIYVQLGGQTYTYDSLGRLKTIESSRYIIKFVYDNNGNLLQKIVTNF
jgi:hypothetical protein